VDGVLETRQPVDASDENVFDAPMLKIGEHAQSEVGSLAPVADPVAQHVAVPPDQRPARCTLPRSRSCLHAAV
jgi:hypothetical protein